MEVSFEDFKKLDIRIGKIISAERIEGADKLLKLMIDIGDEDRQVLAGIAQFYTPEELVGKEIPILVNLQPRKMRGLESNGMILAVDEDGKPVLLNPEKEVPAGSIVK